MFRRRRDFHPPHVQNLRIYGPDRFRRAIERQLGRKLGPRKIGRPTKAATETNDVLKSRR